MEFREWLQLNELDSFRVHKYTPGTVVNQPGGDFGQLGNFAVDMSNRIGGAIGSNFDDVMSRRGSASPTYVTHIGQGSRREGREYTWAIKLPRMTGMDSKSKNAEVVRHVIANPEVQALIKRGDISSMWTKVYEVGTPTDTEQMYKVVFDPHYRLYNTLPSPTDTKPEN